MSKQCTFCARASARAVSRSHSNRGTLRRQYVNLQRKRIEGESFLICARCIKTMKKRESAANGKQLATTSTAKTA